MNSSSLKKNPRGNTDTYKLRDNPQFFLADVTVPALSADQIAEI